MKHFLIIAAITMVCAFCPAFAEDVKIGDMIEKHGMAIQPVYIQPVLMEPGHSLAPEKADIHLEADIQATKQNPHGFKEGSWIPYLKVNYVLIQKGKDWKHEGVLMPMVASDGPHYGDNVALNGPGIYELTYHFESPGAQGFMRHVDKETGVAAWWAPFTLKYQFNWIGSTGKKGGY